METWIQWIANGHPCSGWMREATKARASPDRYMAENGLFSPGSCRRATGSPGKESLGDILSRANRCAGFCTLHCRVAVSPRGLCPLWELPPLSIYMRQGPIQCLEAVQYRPIRARLRACGACSSTLLQHEATCLKTWEPDTSDDPETRKPGGLSEVDSLPGLTADTTVFAIVSQGGDEGPPCEEARYCLQGVPWKFHLLHRGTECPSAGEFASSGDA